MTVDFIESEIDAGKTLYIATYTKCFKIGKNCLDQWRAAGVPLFKDAKGIDENRGFYVARGKHYDFVNESVVHVRFV